MQLYFLRHADAFPKGPKYREESQRPLTSEGKKQAKLIAKFLQGIQFDAILSSSYLRSQQTAQILADRLDAKVESVDELLPGFNLGKLAGLVKTYRKFERVILVGHEPDFSEIVKEMIGGKPELELGKGGLALVEIDLEKDLKAGKLILLVQPEFLA